MIGEALASDPGKEGGMVELRTRGQITRAPSRGSSHGWSRLPNLVGYYCAENRFARGSHERREERSKSFVTISCHNATK